MPAFKVAKVFILLTLTFSIASGIHFCFLKDVESNDKHSSPVESLQISEKLVKKEYLLRSYHPHYLVSLSYPHPMTPHFYYGEVIGNTPLFLYADVDRWHPNSIEKLTINGFEYTDASAKFYLLRREEVFRYMFVLQMQNSYEHDLDYLIQVHERQDHFLIICKYEDTVKAFSLYLTEKGKMLRLDSHLGVKVFIRNETGSSARNNWRFSRQVRWLGQDSRSNNVEYAGLVVQIQYFNRNLLNTVKLNLRELPYRSSLSMEGFLTQQHSSFVGLQPQHIQIKQKYGNCSATAYQKVLDGLSYEYGRLQIRDGQNLIENEPKQLLSFCPSGKRFPWGFLWDDGFHCEVAVRKDKNTVIKVIKSWLDTMLDNGWIPREQNRGTEREELCNCPRFMPKDIRDGNPPTLLLALDYLNKRNLLSRDTFPMQYWNKLKKWYSWFMKTQRDGEAMLFKWHDSLDQHGASFTSGMDDFPRPSTSKGQIDLQTWIYFFTKFLVEASHIYDQYNEDFVSNLELIKNNFYFYVSGDGTYRDIGVDGSFSEHFGYPNILPIAFGIPAYKSREYNSTINKVRQELDIGYGLASISKRSSLYLENKDAYWRGPVWINLNYLFLRGLKLYYPQEKELYHKVRKDVLSTVCGNWQKSGYFYENYIEGKGSFGYPFNGWTSLVAIIEEENY